MFVQDIHRARTSNAARLPGLAEAPVGRPRGVRWSRAAACTAVLLLGGPALAQLGLGSGGGGPSADPVGLPIAGFESLEVRRAEVELDLRGVHASPRVACDGVYTVINPSPDPVESRVVVLQGSSPHYASPPPRADLDGVELAPPERTTIRWDLMWYLVPRVPAPAGYAPERFAQHESDPLAFRMRVPPGEHRVRVRQHAWTLDVLDRQKLFGQYLIEYGLSPSRRWSGLRELVLRVRVPRGWPAASSPPLDREGDVLTGRWSAAPGPVLSLSVHVPHRSLGDARALPWALIVAGVAASLFAGVAVGRRLRRSSRPWTLALLGVPAALVGPGLLHHLGDRVGAAIIAHRVGYPPFTDIVTGFTNLLGVFAGGLAAALAYLLASLLAHRPGRT